MKIGGAKVPNHGAIFVGRGLMYHHPSPTPALGRRTTQSLSRIEPIAGRLPYITHVLRYNAS